MSLSSIQPLQSSLVTNLAQLKNLSVEDTAMSLNDNQPLQSPLANNLAQLKKLSEEDSLKHAVEISSLLLWVARNNPDLFEGNSKELEGVYVRRLYFQDSWELPDELIPTDALKTLLGTYDIKGLCGYMDPCVLEHLDEKPLDIIRLALGKHNNAQLLIEKLKCRRIRHISQNYTDDNIMIHLRCGELDLKDLVPLPNNRPKLYISNASDQDTAWVVQAATALLPKIDPSGGENYDMEAPYFGALKLPRSKLTPAGVEAIAKGLFNVGVMVDVFQISCPHLDEDEKIPGNEDKSDFCMMISDKYNMDCVTFDDDKGLEFTEFADNISDDSSNGYALQSPLTTNLTQLKKPSEEDSVMSLNSNQPLQSPLATNLDQPKELSEEDTAMSSNSNQPLQSPLANNLAKLKKLSEEDTIKYAAEISSLLLWVVSNHPDIFEGNSKELEGIYVKRLYFRDSWEFPDELIPSDSLKTLLKSYEIKGICGYMEPCVLEHLDEQPLDIIRLSLGRHINVQLLIEELNCRRIKQLSQNYTEDNIMIHLRCGELELKDLVPLPNTRPKLFISDVSDQDTAWVVQAATALLPKIDPRVREHDMEVPYFGALKLPRSKLTPGGVEAIAKGLFDVGIMVDEFQVSCPHLDENEEIPGYEDKSDFCMMLSDKYNMDSVSFDDDKGLEFTEFTDKYL